MTAILAWYLEGIDYRDAPSTIAELRSKAGAATATRDELLQSAKWEHLLRGKKSDLPPGWVFLEELASTRRGIATGANNFFLISRDALERAEIRDSLALPCVGRAIDVPHFVFTEADFGTLTLSGGKTQLLNLRGNLTDSEQRYVAYGESLGLRSRYLLANRTPWYSMEQRDVSPIWAAVFGRGDLKFVYNQAAVRSLTNFHCVYPYRSEPVFAQALTFCLNTPLVREHSKLHTRVYGGGLSKFEPNDLKQIPLPDLRRVSERTLSRLSEALFDMDNWSRSPARQPHYRVEDKLAVAAGQEASGS